MPDDPTVSMLWEEADVNECLANRFGFASPGAAVEWLGETLERRWGLAVVGCDRLVISAWNVLAWITADDRRLIAKWSAFPPKFSRLRRSARVTEWLDAHGVPVALPIPTVGGAPLVEIGNEFRGRARARLPLPGSRFLLGLLPVIDGDLLDVGDPAQVRDAARTLAAVHEALAVFPDHRRPRGQQLVHNDFRSANLLHDGSRVNGVLDLDEVAYGTRAADLAKAAVFLGTRYRDWAPTAEEVRRAFVSAYQELAPLTGAERRTLGERIGAELTKQGWS
ncbi:MAG TPA: phosphotransferase [Acidimicrobiales bacterium]|nr:phosphotransferase [Acidimicrobiales bacterium]